MLDTLLALPMMPYAMGLAAVLLVVNYLIDCVCGKR
jgi:hypothetical protein